MFSLKLSCIAASQLKFGLLITFLLQTIVVADISLSSTLATLVNGGSGIGPSSSSSSLPPNCLNVRSLFESREINATDIPTNPINGKFLYGIRVVRTYDDCLWRHISSNMHIRKRKMEISNLLRFLSPSVLFLYNKMK